MTVITGPPDFSLTVCPVKNFCSVISTLSVAAASRCAAALVPQPQYKPNRDKGRTENETYSCLREGKSPLAGGELLEAGDAGASREDCGSGAAEVGDWGSGLAPGREHTLGLKPKFVVGYETRG